MANQEQLDLLQQGVAETWNTWRAREMYVLIPHAQAEHRGEDGPSHVPEPFGP